MNRFLTSLIAALTLTSLQAQTLQKAPRLVIVLTIDQLRTDYLDDFSSILGQDGFKKLWKEGRVYCNAEFTFNKIDRSSAVAAIYSGTTPSINGIISNQWMDIKSLQTVNSTDDKSFMGYYTDENSAATRLLSSTITDELKIASQKRALVYSISPFRDTAILSAGHAANGAFWINKNTGKWCGTTYYGDFPEWINQYNESKSVDYRIKDIVWEPVYPRFMYSFLPDWRDLNFKYKFADNHENKYRRLITSPYVNDEVNALTETLLNKTDIGTDNITDLLCLTYYAGNYNHKSIQECATEIQDTYVRLDRSLANLLKIIKGKIDLKDVLFCITSTGYSDTESADHGSYNIPGGEFHMNRCAALLNMYLMATYGEGKYIETYYNQQIFLNHKLLENKNLNLEEVEKKTAEFLVQFSGVNEVYTSNQLLLGAWTPEIEKRRNSYNRKLSGDIMVDVLPGWTIVDEKNSNTKNVRLEFTPSPFIFFGYDIKPAIIQTPVTIDHIAPTLSRLIRIRAPNGCKAAPFVDIQ